VYDHGTSEPFHRKRKTDLNIKRLPNGKSSPMHWIWGVFANTIPRLIARLGLP